MEHDARPSDEPATIIDGGEVGREALLPWSLVRAAFLESWRSATTWGAAALGLLLIVVAGLLPLRFREPSAFFLESSGGPLLLTAVLFAFTRTVPSFTATGFLGRSPRLGPVAWSGPRLTAAVLLGQLGAWGTTALLLGALVGLGLPALPLLHTAAVGPSASSYLELGQRLAAALLQGASVVAVAALIAAALGRTAAWVTLGLLLLASSFWAGVAHRPEAPFFWWLLGLPLPALDLLALSADNPEPSLWMPLAAVGHVLFCNVLTGLILERRAGAVAAIEAGAR